MIRKIENKFIETRIDDEMVLVQIDRGTFHALKGTGLATWELINGARDHSEIVTMLTNRFRVPTEQCNAEVARFIDQLQTAGLIALD